MQREHNANYVKFNSIANRTDSISRTSKGEKIPRGAGKKKRLGIACAVLQSQSQSIHSSDR
jgi:hypothetical protein